ncbi:MAG: ATP-dependent helicase [Syntrophobacterales bacterium]|jgi:DNA helicase-2/ATP-dependent DNA helicase PcrA|nr:ATP-dependent helicase [Syntrophobacterales bacterium]
MIDFRQELNDAQYQVVMEEGGPLLVIAGAGSGKTRTLTYRVTRLIDAGCYPGHILLATFTNKAAKSMVGRVQILLDRELTGLWGGTFHHIAHRILRANAAVIGFDSHFTIIDSDDMRQLMNSCLTEMNLGKSDSHFPKGPVLADILSFSVNTDDSVANTVMRRYPTSVHYTDEIESVLNFYQNRKRVLQVMDFDDLLFFCRNLLRDFPQVLDRYRNRFLHVLVDEYQDTNRIQAEIMDLLASGHGNIMVVGDDSQSIYSFRGADFENILQFPHKYPHCRIYKLETNYRSTPEILHLANLCIINNERQFRKELVSMREGGVKPAVVPLRNVYQQAEFIAQRVIELAGEGIPLTEMAILYRAHYHSMELQLELGRRGIPFEIRSGIRFFEQAHVKDVVSYLRIVDNPLDELSWRRVLGLYPGIGKVTIKKLWDYLRRQSTDPLRAFLCEEGWDKLPKGAREGFKACADVFRRLEGRVEANPQELVEAAMYGYVGFLRSKYPDWSSREDDLVRLAAYASKFSSLHAMLEELSLMTNTEEEERDDLPKTEREGRIVLTSIHQAKGLEWSVVFLIWCCEGMFPLVRALEEEGGEEEERRLFYVAVTRAKDHLYLCYPTYDPNRGLGYNTPLRPSRFIRELKNHSPWDGEKPFEQWVVDISC